MGKFKEARTAVLEVQRLETFDNKAWPLMSSSALLSEIDKAMGR